MATFKNMISERRKEKGLTLRQLGKLVEISPSYLSEIEHGVKPPPKEEKKINMLAQVLGLSKKNLLELAQTARLTGTVPNVLSKWLNQEQEIALGLCRVAEDEESMKEFNELIKKFISDMEEKQKHNG